MTDLSLHSSSFRLPLLFRLNYRCSVCFPDVTDDEEIKSLLEKLRVQHKDRKKSRMGFKSRINGRPSSQRISGIRGLVTEC